MTNIFIDIPIQNQVYIITKKNILTDLWFEIQLRYTIQLTSVVATPRGIIILSSDILPTCGPVCWKNRLRILLVVLHCASRPVYIEYKSLEG
jgi:hypothetical protein